MTIKYIIAFYTCVVLKIWNAIFLLSAYLGFYLSSILGNGILVNTSYLYM